MEAAEQCHGDVGVAVDEAGKDQLAAGVDHLNRGVAGTDLGARTGGEDGVALNRNGTVVVDVPVAVHGDHHAGYQQVSSKLGVLGKTASRK
jgi:hypothetical protein